MHYYKSILKWPAAVAGLAVGGYAAYAAFEFARYGRTSRPTRACRQSNALDQFLPRYEVCDHHAIRVSAPAPDAFHAACHADLMASPVVRAIFKLREFLLFGEPTRPSSPQGLRTFIESIGWGVLSEIPDRLLVFGSVTQPWLAEPVFQKLSPLDFIAFQQPDFVKIVWSLEALRISPNQSVLLVETRALATDKLARAKFRPYWSLGSPGIKLIRLVLLRQARAIAERSAGVLRPSVAQS